MPKSEPRKHSERRERRRFYVVSEQEISEGKVVDIYFLRALESMKTLGMSQGMVTAELAARSLPKSMKAPFGPWKWAVLAGVEEVTKLLEGRRVELYSLPDGSVFHAWTPVMRIEGPYEEFGSLETSLLGFMCALSGVASAAAHVKVAAGEKPVIGFGIRRNHPAISLAIERASLIGGIEGSSGILVEEIGFPPMGTMPHSLIVIAGDQVEAWRAFDRAMPEEVPRIALVDTFYDEKQEAIMAAEALRDKLAGVRLDTPKSRRGSMEEVVKEVRWELDIRGFEHVKIFVSGGLDEASVESLVKAGADSFGVGSRIAAAPPVDFGMDIVEVEGTPIAKRGVRAGAKDLHRCPNCLHYSAVIKGEAAPSCRKCEVEMRPAYVQMLKRGEVVAEFESVRAIRERTLNQLRRLSLL